MSAVAAASWEMWLLNHKITVDPDRKLFIIADGVTDIDVQVDLFSDYKEWFKAGDNAKLGEVAMRSIGGDPTIAGEFAGDIYFMINGWRVAYDPRKVAVTGVLFSEDYDTPWLNKLDLQPIYPAKVASLVTRVSVDLSELGIPSAVQIAEQVRTELSPELAQVTNTNTTVATIDGKVTVTNQVLRNKTETDPVAGTMTVYADNGIDVLFVANIWENVAATTPYAGNAVNRRERLE